VCVCVCVVTSKFIKIGHWLFPANLMTMLKRRKYALIKGLRKCFWTHI